MANKSRFVNIDPSWLANMQARARQKREEQAVQLARQNQPFVLEVGDCACGGKVNFHFEGFKYTGPLSDLRIGGSNPTTEVSRCVCALCGHLFDSSSSPIAESIVKHRAGL
jgi:hypothetical protein